MLSSLQYKCRSYLTKIYTKVHLYLLIIRVVTIIRRVFLNINTYILYISPGKIDILQRRNTKSDITKLD